MTNENSVFMVIDLLEKELEILENLMLTATRPETLTGLHTEIEAIKDKLKLLRKQIYG